MEHTLPHSIQALPLLPSQLRPNICEVDYIICPYLAELVNTLTNSLYIT